MQTDSGMDLVLVQLQWGKDDSAFSIHAHPSSFTHSGGLQTTDFLHKLGFTRGECGFLNQCYAKFVSNNCKLDLFSSAFDSAYKKLILSEKSLQACGYFFEATEGTSMYSNRRPSPNRKESYFGNGHTSTTPAKLIKESEDDTFRFKFTWIENSQRGKGWTVHYAPKHSPLSVEIESAFSYIGIKPFTQCPEFDFDPCHWHFFPYQNDDDNIFNFYNESVHRYFDNHKEHFSNGIKLLLEAEVAIEAANMSFLPTTETKTRLEKKIPEKLTKPALEDRPAKQFEFDVAISFAGSERKYAEEIATKLRIAGFSVFYDDFYPEDLWGKDLAITFSEIYSKKSRFCLILVSDHYNNREWTVHERSNALSRMVKEKGNEYILPIKIDDVSLPGLPDTIGYISIDKGIDTIIGLLIKKLQKV